MNFKVFYKVSYNQEEEDSDGVYYTKHESIGIRETDISRLEFTEEEILDINDEKYTAELLFVTDEKNVIIKKYGGN